MVGKPLNTKAASRKKTAVRNAEQLGERLRKLRRIADLSLNELARKAGVSVGMISQVERNLSNPSIRTLERLRQALGVPLTTLLEGDEGDAVSSEGPAEFVRRVEERPHFSVSAGGLEKELLSPHGDHEMKFMIIMFPPHTRSEDILIGAGEKAGLVLEGEISLTVADCTERLRSGDSFQFSSLLSHGVANPYDAPARVLWIMNPRQATIQL